MARYLGKLSSERSSRIVYLFTRLYAVVTNTLLESVRQPVYAVILGGATILIAITPYITMFTMNDSPSLMKDMGLATIMLAGMLMAAFSASKVVSEEIDNRTVLTVVSKPVGRGVFIIGKFVGVLVGIMIGVYLLSLVYILTITGGAMEADIEQKLNLWVVAAIFGALFISVCYGIYSNFFHDKSFPSRTLAAAVPLLTIAFIILVLVDPRKYPNGDFIDRRLIYACIMVLWSVLVMAGLAVAVSTRLTVVVTVSICSGIFILGLLSDYLFGPELLDGRFVHANWLAQVLYRVIPNLQVFWVRPLMDGNHIIPLEHVVSGGIYATFHLGAALLLAMILFEERQVS